MVWSPGLRRRTGRDWGHLTGTLGEHMHARITRYKMKPGSTAAARELMESLRGEIMGLPGLRHYYNAMKEDGSGYIVSVIEPAEVSADNDERVRAIWGKFAEFLEEMPTPETLELIADWSR
jgi:hypothetical protein